MLLCYFFFFKQKTAYEMRISDWSSDVCSSETWRTGGSASRMSSATIRPLGPDPATVARSILRSAASRRANGVTLIPFDSAAGPKLCSGVRSEEHTSELQSLMRISYAVFCLKKKTKQKT